MKTHYVIDFMNQFIRGMTLFILILFPGMNNLKAGIVITEGTTLKVVSGTRVVTSEGVLVKSNGMLDNAGYVTLKKNLENENAMPSLMGTGTVELAGTIAQTVSGQNVFNNLVINNAAGIILTGETEVNGVLTLTSGLLDLGTVNLLLGPAASVAGTPSAGAMIVAVSGELRKEFPAGFTGSFTYPVGDKTGTNEYSLVVLTITGATFGSGNYIGLVVVNDKYPDPGITGNYLKRYWTISQSGVSAFSCNATFHYTAADVIGTESVLSCSKVNPVPWITYGLTDPALHMLTATGVTAFSSFTGVKSAMAPVSQELQNITLNSGISNCYDAQQHLTVAGDGSSFLVNSGASVVLIAGEMITMLPGTMVNSGGYLHGYITLTGNFCSNPIPPVPGNTPTDDQITMEVLQPETSDWIKVYPNPTSDRVEIEYKTGSESAGAQITIYNLLGSIIRKDRLTGDFPHKVSLSELPPGIYIIRLNAQDRSGIAKIIKK
jgi:hypothetical protein